MRIEMSLENEIVLNSVLEEIDIIKQEVTELSLDLLIQIKVLLIKFIMSYKEYSFSNIKELGIGEVLWIRALRFFKLNQERSKEERINEKGENKRPVFQYLLKKGARLAFYPVYKLTVLIMKNRQAVNRKDARKTNKYVKLE